MFCETNRLLQFERVRHGANSAVIVVTIFDKFVASLCVLRAKR